MSGNPHDPELRLATKAVRRHERRAQALRAASAAAAWETHLNLRVLRRLANTLQRSAEATRAVTRCALDHVLRRIDLVEAEHATAVFTIRRLHKENSDLLRSATAVANARDNWIRRNPAPRNRLTRCRSMPGAPPPSPEIPRATIQSISWDVLPAARGKAEESDSEGEDESGDGKGGDGKGGVREKGGVRGKGE